MHAPVDIGKMDKKSKPWVGKGGFSTKIHALVDALGLPIRFILTSGQISEINRAGA